jgi:hypothetical protein
MLHIIREIDLFRQWSKSWQPNSLGSSNGRAQYHLHCRSRKVQQGMVAGEIHRLQCHLMKHTIFQERL